jgi:hypothetical protein
MIEIAKRSEPKDLKKSLDFLEGLLFTQVAIAKEKKAVDLSVLKADYSELQKEITALKIKLGFATRRLAKMESEFNANTIASISFQTLVEYDLNKGNKPHPLCKQQLNILATKIKACDPLKQEQLKARIQGIKSEVAYLEKALHRKPTGETQIHKRTT